MGVTWDRGAQAPLARPAIAPQPCSAPSDPLSVGTLFAGRYEIQRQLGAGGSAVVYLARDPAWDGLREDPRFVRITERVGR